MSRFARNLLAVLLCASLAFVGGLPLRLGTPPAAAAAGTPYLRSGEQLVPGQSLVSADGRYQMILQNDRNLVVYGPYAVLWYPGRLGDRLVMQGDGNLVLLANGVPQWNSGTAGNPGAYLVMQTDGNVVIYTPNGRPLWYTGADRNLGDTLLPGQSVLAGGSMRTAGGNIQLHMQTDGNLVRYELGRPTAWTGTSGNNARLILQTDGNLVIYTDRGAVWNSGTAGRGATAFRLQEDSNAVVYNGSTPTWWMGASWSFVTIGLVNAERAKVGCPALSVDWRLQKAAVLHSEDMRNRNYFSHTTPEGLTPTDRARAQGFPGGAGENIAAGYPTPESAVAAWMASQGHRENIQYCDYRVTGFGIAYGGSYRIYWTQMFAF